MLLSSSKVLTVISRTRNFGQVFDIRLVGLFCIARVFLQSRPSSPRVRVQSRCCCPLRPGSCNVAGRSVDIVRGGLGPDPESLTSKQDLGLPDKARWPKLKLDLCE